MSYGYEQSSGGGFVIEEPAAKRPRLDQWALDYSPGYLPSVSEVYQESQPDRIENGVHQDAAALERFWTNLIGNPSQAHDVSHSTITDINIDPITELEYDTQPVVNSTWNAQDLPDQNRNWAYEKEYQENSLANSTVAEGEIVDETSIVPVDQVCIGMISDVPITATQSSLLNFDTSKISLIFSKPNLLHHVGRETIFGELDERPAKILASLSTEEGICFQISCRTINRRAAPGKKGSRKPGANELQYVMNTIIYGPAELSDPIGQYLTKCGVHLQDPLDCDRNVPYSNPHILSRSDEIIMTDSLISLTLEPEVEKIIAQEDLFSELSSDAHLALTDAPDSIATPLYVHQKKALTFMMKREEGWQYDGSQEDLWVKEVDETGHMTYTNMVTETSQKSVPPETKGGLLADQMGLGKSLTMISLIALNTCRTSEPIIFTSQGTLRRLKSTLVVVPYSLLGTWDTQLRRHLRPGSLTWMRFHGTQKRKTLALGRHDIVITTFETLVRQLKRHLDSKVVEDTLFSFFWHRIVLDEAHTIRNRATAMARASCAIHATNRWSITGTPIQNRVSDFASQLEFLKIYPFSNPKVFDTEITKPWLKSGDRDVTRLKRLVNCMSLCRTKAIIDLPKRDDLIHHLEFSPEEQEFYDKAKEGTIRKLDHALSSNPLQPGQYLNALQWLNELRLICNHGLVHSKRDSNKCPVITPQDTQTWNKSTANKAFETIVTANEAICSVCGNVLTDGAGGGSNSDFPKPYLAKCLTLTCGSCVKDYPSGQPVPTCSHLPLCKSVEVSWTPDIFTVAGVGKTLPDIPEEQVSTKLKMLLRDLQTCPKGEKSVVFSYWTFTLDLIESLLKKASISYTRIDGQHSGDKREEAIQKFQTDDSIQIILVSITCGGAGLDLTAASVAYLLEPQWNPMMEEQALCRIHRLGQRKEVKTIRYRIRGSFEERVVATQDLKKEIAAEAFSLETRRNPLDNSKRLQHLREQLG